ncbi:hypothetical protein [Streptomyces enissocaesilis]|uniref:Tetracyclin repressor-like C-terminal group 31 domain-containing protein n=1 Tax=Streptomyces enissocaesilis TaxID=332589 RepID=A0ABN3XFE0_9ACTN
MTAPPPAPAGAPDRASRPGGGALLAPGAELRRARERFAERARPVAAGLGSPGPVAGGRIVVAFAEGLTYDGVVRPGSGTTGRTTLRQALETVLAALATPCGPR